MPNPLVPQHMKALRYTGPEQFTVATIPVPEIGDEDVLGMV